MTTKVIGKSLPRIDAIGKVTGQTQYPGDISRPDMLHMQILFAGRPHARVISIDTEKALSMPGVVAIFTAKDVPVNEYGLQWQDQPVLCGPGSSKPGTDIVRFIGDQVALVIAETESQAAAARDLIEVEYEDLPVITDPREEGHAKYRFEPLWTHRLLAETHVDRMAKNGRLALGCLGAE